MRRQILKIATTVAGSILWGLAAETAFSAPIQWSIEDGGNGHFYEAVLHPDGITWLDALAEAEAAGGHLATITSAAENDFVSSLFSGNPDFWLSPAPGGFAIGPWIGGFQPPDAVEPDQGFMWVTGESFGFTNWAAGQPDNFNDEEEFIHFIGIGVDNFSADTWNDLPNDFSPFNPRAYILEFESVPEPSSVVGLLAFGAIGICSLLTSKRP